MLDSFALAFDPVFVCRWIINDTTENRLQQLSIEMKKLLLEFLEMDDNNIWNILNSSKYSKKYDSLVKLIYPIN